MTGEGTSKGRILIVDDDTTVSQILARYLVRDGFVVDRAVDGEGALRQTEAQAPDLILLDLMLPGISGLDVCRRVRRFSGVPIIMLTARGEENERVFGLRLGADDYVVKPFSPREVAARVASVLRRTKTSSQPGSSLISAGDLEVDLRARTVHAGGRALELTVREFDLLAFLARHPGHVFRRAELLERVWGYTIGDTATVTVHVRRLRAKLEDDATRPRQIETVWGIGYRFRAA